MEWMLGSKYLLGRVCPWAFSLPPVPLVVVSLFLLSFTPVETSVCPEVPNLGLV